MQKQNNSLAIISFIMGILGLFGLIPLIGSILAVVLGHLARRQLAADPSQAGDGIALAGLIMGYVGLVVACSGILVVTLFFSGSLMALIAGLASSASMLL